jgi:hypothetical protein
VKLLCSTLLLLVTISIEADTLKLTATSVPDDQTASGPLHIELTLQNNSKKDIEVLTAVCHLPPWYNAAPRTDIILTDLTGDLHADDTESAIIDQPPLSAVHSIAPLFHEAPLLLYKKVHADVTIHYRYVGEDAEQPVFAQEIQLPAQAPLWHVLLGSVVGIIVLFTLLLFAKQLPKTPGLTFGLAIIAVPLAIVLTVYASQYLALLPVKVDLRDFMGGFVVGLLGLWLTPKIVGGIVKPANDSAAPPAAPAPAEQVGAHPDH